MAENPKQPNLDEIMQMAQKMQQSMKTAHDELTSMRIKGEAGGSLVKLTINGKHNCVRTYIDPTLISCDPAKLKEELEVLEDLVTAAINDATNKVETEAQKRIAKVSKELGLPENLELPEGGDNQGDTGQGDDDDDGGSQGGFGGFGSSSNT